MFSLETVFDICLKYKECYRCPRHELRGYRDLYTEGLKDNIIRQQQKLVDHHHLILLFFFLGRFWRSTGLQRTQWQMVSGWFGQLGNGMCTCKSLWSIHQDHSSAGLDEPNHELRKVHLCLLPITPTLTWHSFLILLTCLPKKESVGCCQTQDALLN